MDVGAVITQTVAWAVVALVAGCPSTNDPGDAVPVDSDATDLMGTDISDVDSAPEVAQPVAACGTATLRQTPLNPGEPGPWQVGVMTLTTANLPLVEVWYPVAPGDETGSQAARYDIRDTLPPSQQELIPSEDAPVQTCDCFRDAPLDTTFGPYPVVVFIHGTASFRTQSLGQMLHWARRGFVVIAAQHPGLFLGDLLSIVCPDDPTGEQSMVADVTEILDALRLGEGDWAAIAPYVDMGRVGVAGHSAGGRAAAESGGLDGVRLVIPMASGTPTTAGPLLAFSLFMGGTADEVVPLATSESAFDKTAGARALAVLDRAPHLAFSDLCGVSNSAGTDLLSIAQQYGVCGAELGEVLFDCDDTLLPVQTADAIIDYITTVALEEHLQCRQRSTPWSDALALFTDLVEIRQAP